MHGPFGDDHPVQALGAGPPCPDPSSAAKPGLVKASEALAQAEAAVGDADGAVRFQDRISRRGRGAGVHDDAGGVVGGNGDGRRRGRDGRLQQAAQERVGFAGGYAKRRRRDDAQVIRFAKQRPDIFVLDRLAADFFADLIMSHGLRTCDEPGLHFDHFAANRHVQIAHSFHCFNCSKYSL